MSAAASDVVVSRGEGVGLSSQEVARRLAQFGPNEIAEETVHPARRLARQFWAPVPWMLEAAIVLQLVIGERLEALAIGTLLILNVGLGAFQESRANAALALLKQRLSLIVRVKRDGVWGEVAEAMLVPGDIVQLSLGKLTAADVRVAKGSLLVDQSMITGESMPVERSRGETVHAGALVRRGEAIGEVVATGASTYYGRTAELVRVAHVESAEQKVVLSVVRNLTVVNFAIVIGLVAYAHAIGMAAPQIIPLVLTALLSAVPVALPATFTLAAALGAKALALKGVLLTRLSALHEAAMIDVLCADKTGTLTANEMAVSRVYAARPDTSEGDVIAFAAAASSSEGQDPIDLTIRAMAIRQDASSKANLVLVRFTPFDPAIKMAEATVTCEGRELRVVKGAPAVVTAHVAMPAAAAAQLDAFTQAGHRTIAVAAGPPDALELIGLIAFVDPPRNDAGPLLTELRKLGVRTVMVTGDAATTAATIARTIGIDGPVCPASNIPESADPDDYGVYAGVFPEQKFRLVKAFQKRGHAVGMCGDGANDAPALRQAQMGIAVATATDVAKSAAGLVLTEPGLSGIVTSIKEGRSAFQRILSYTLTVLVNKSATLVVLGVGLVVTGQAVLTPLLIAISMLTNDFVTMARAADRAPYSPFPNAWQVRNLVIAAIPLGLLKLGYCVAILATGWYWLHFTPGEMQTLTFTMLVLANQALMFVLRTRGHFWCSPPARIVVFASFVDVCVVGLLAMGGILMAPLPAAAVIGLVVATLAYALATDFAKLAVLAHLAIDRAMSPHRIFYNN